MFKQISQEDGQGLVEYALLLVLVAIVAFVILSILGTQVATVFANVGEVIDGGSIVNMETERFGSGQHVRLNITTNSNVRITATLEDGSSRSKNCNQSCSITFNNVGSSSGTIALETDDDTALIPYAMAP